MNRDRRSDEKCSICLAPMRQALESMPASGIRTCPHQFHRECLQGWIGDKRRPNCPNCRKEFSPQDVYTLEIRPPPPRPPGHDITMERQGGDANDFETAFQLQQIELQNIIIDVPVSPVSPESSRNQTTSALVNEDIVLVNEQLDEINRELTSKIELIAQLNSKKLSLEQDIRMLRGRMSQLRRPHEFEGTCADVCTQMGCGFLACCDEHLHRESEMKNELKLIKKIEKTIAGKSRNLNDIRRNIEMTRLRIGQLTAMMHEVHTFADSLEES